METNTKLVLNFALGKRNQATTDIFIEGLRHATGRQNFQVTTDGFVAYRSSIPNTLGDRANFATLTKVYRATPEGERRYSPAEGSDVRYAMCKCGRVGITHNGHHLRADDLRPQCPGITDRVWGLGELLSRDIVGPRGLSHSMFSGRRYRLTNPTLALDLVNGKHVAVTVPTGTIIEVLDGPTELKENALMKVRWDDRNVSMFALDIDVRGQLLPESGNTVDT